MDPERLLKLRERLDAVYEGIARPYGDDATQQEFLYILTELATGSRDERMWNMVSRWARDRAES